MIRVNNKTLYNYYEDHNYLPRTYHKKQLNEWNRDLLRASSRDCDKWGGPGETTLAGGKTKTGGGPRAKAHRGEGDRVFSDNAQAWPKTQGASEVRWRRVLLF